MNTNTPPAARLNITRKPSNLLKGNVLGQGFKPGHSANPGGRPKGLAAFVCEQTKDGKELVQIMHTIATGTLLIERSHWDKEGVERVSCEKPSHRDRIAAIEWLADRGFGRCITTLEVSAKDGKPLEAEAASVGQLQAELLKRGCSPPQYGALLITHKPA